jgi:type IV pilus assembly protein PilM
MAEKVIGLDVGTNAVRAVALTMGERPRLDLMGQVALPQGAVHEGEVIDQALVASSVKTLWKDSGFGRRPVRVGIASARVILRVVDMPEMSEADTRSALRLQLGDYVPLAPNATVFDFQRLAPVADEDGGADHGRLLLAAAPRDAVEPLVAAVRKAGLKVAGVDVIPAALARVLARTTDHDDHDVRAIVSLGAGTIVVVVARGAEPLFARTVTNVSGGHITDRIASALSVSPAEAERFKWHAPSGDFDDVALRVQAAAEPTVREIVEEIRDSLDYYSSQPGGLEIGSIVLTGGDALIVGLRQRLEERVGVPVSLADPFVGLDRTGKKVDAKELERLAPFMSAAVGIALGGAESRRERIDLTPEAVSADRKSRLPVLLGGGAAAALLLGGGYLYVQQGEDISAAKAERALVESQVAAAQQRAAEQAAQAEPDEASSLPALYAAARATDAEWATVAEQLDGLGEPMGIAITSVVGSASTAAATTAPTTTPPPASAPANGTSAAPATTTPATTAPAAPAAVVPGDLASATVSGTAPDLDAIAAWIDAVSANPRFGTAWVDTTNKVENEDGSVELQFTAQMPITGANLVPRNLPEANPA